LDAPDLYSVRSSDGKLLAASPAEAVHILSQQDSATSDFELHGIPYRAIHVQHLPVLDKEEDNSASDVTLNVSYGASTFDLRRSLMRAVSTVLGAGLVLLGLSVWLSVWAINSGLRPLSDLAISAGSITASNWQLNPPPSALNT